MNTAREVENLRGTGTEAQPSGVDVKFVKSELKVTASEELEEEIRAELEEEQEEKSMASILNKGKKSQ
jgi:hypothetical protein|tara:strand:- start:12319 stop:12522 length:204 start_codon:yes stop_codon:yes gene_type:complete